MTMLKFTVWAVVILWAGAILGSLCFALWKQRSSGKIRVVIREAFGQSMPQYCQRNIPPKLLWLLVALSLGLLVVGVLSGS
jgi:hypothetical protein